MKSLLLTFLFIYFTLLMIICPIFYGEKIHSVFSTLTEDENLQIEEQANAERKMSARSHLKNLRSQGTRAKFYHHEKLQNISNNHVIIVIVNKPESYTDDESNKYILTQLVRQIDEDLQNEHQTGMFICNRSSENFVELDQLSRSYPVYNFPFTLTNKKFTYQNILKNNFIQCVNLGLGSISYVPQYITVLRDTVVPYQRFMYSLRTLLDTKVNSWIRRGERVSEPRTPWMYLHLQEPSDLRSFGFDWSSIKELFAVSVIGALVMFFYFTVVERPRNRSFKLFTRTSQLFICFGAVLFFTLALVVGRPYLTELRRSYPGYLRLYETYEPVELSAVTMTTVNAQRMIKELNKFLCSNYLTFSHTWHHLSYSFETPGYVVSPSLVRYV